LTSRTVSFLVVVAALAPAVGCGRSKVTQCNALVGSMNGGVQAVQKIDNVSTDPKSAGALRQMGDALEKASGEAAKVDLSIGDLKTLRDQYVTLSKETAQAARDMATAAEAKDKEKIASINQALEKHAATEQTLVDSVNKFCQVP